MKTKAGKEYVKRISDEIDACTKEMVEISQLFCELSDNGFYQDEGFVAQFLDVKERREELESLIGTAILMENLWEMNK